MKIHLSRLLLLTIIITSCTSIVTDDTINLPTFDLSENVSLTDNNELSIELPNEWNTFRIGDSIGILIYNMSDRDFVFEYSDVKIYELNNTNISWNEIPNKTINTGNEKVIIGAKDNPNSLSTVGVFFHPDISRNQNDSTFVKIVILGNFSGINGTLESDKKAMVIDIKLNR